MTSINASKENVFKTRQITLIDLVQAKLAEQTSFVPVRKSTNFCVSVTAFRIVHLRPNTPNNWQFSMQDFQ
jgi:hypothetical protein